MTLVLLLKPGIGLDEAILFAGEDKLVHFGLFGTLTVLWCRYFVIDITLNHKTMVIIVLSIGTLLAGGTELLQMFIPGRQTDLADFISNILGVVSGTIFYMVIGKKESIIR